MKSIDLLTVSELASILKVKLRWVYMHTRQTGPNSIPRIQVGRHIRFELDKVMQWLNDNTTSNQ
jgi:excisionase family DNA binding protein